MPRKILPYREFEEFLRQGKTLPISGDMPLRSLTQPLTHFAMSKLAGKSKCILSPEAWASLENSLQKKLMTTARQVFDFDWRCFCSTPGLLQKKETTGEQIKKYFVQGIEVEVLRLMGLFPGLGEIWLVQVVHWLEFIEGFLVHAENFARKGRKTAAPALITRLETDLSDPHRGQRTVIGTYWSDHSCWYYKPRPGKSDAAWQNLLSTINEAGFQPAFRVLKVIDCVDHCWMEATEWKPCTSEEDGRNFFFQAGATLYLVQMLRGVDVHMGNLIAHGAHPILIDAETLLHPNTRRYGNGEQTETSIFRTGMIAESCEKFGELDNYSALGSSSPGSNVPTLHGIALRLSDHPDCLLAGYLKIHAFCKGSCCLQPSLNNFSMLIWRRILRPTSYYDALLRDSFQPKFLADNSSRAAFLRKNLAESTSSKKQAEQEFRALLEGDIPIFLGRTRVNPHPLTERVLKKGCQNLRNLEIDIYQQRHD